MKNKTVGNTFATKADLQEGFKNLSEMLHDTFIIKEEFREYRNEMLTRFDQVVGELAQIRENWLFTNHEIKELKARDDDHETRLKKIEDQTKN